MNVAKRPKCYEDIYKPKIFDFYIEFCGGFAIQTFHCVIKMKDHYNETKTLLKDTFTHKVFLCSSKTICWFHSTGPAAWRSTTAFDKGLRLKLLRHPHTHTNPCPLFTKHGQLCNKQLITFNIVVSAKVVGTFSCLFIGVTLSGRKEKINLFTDHLCRSIFPLLVRDCHAERRLIHGHLSSSRSPPSASTRCTPSWSWSISEPSLPLVWSRRLHWSVCPFANRKARGRGEWECTM